MKRRVVLLGPPGSGKGTIAACLMRDFGLTHLSSGHWLRREVEMDTAIGRQVQMFLDNGELAPDELVLAFMEQRLSGELDGPGFMLDGFPRTLMQAQALDAWLAERDRPIEAVLLFDCAESVILERVGGRRVCSGCGAGYHLKNQPPKRAGQCDRCQAELVQREDDTEAVLRKRLRVYQRDTQPLIQYYHGLGKLKVVDANQPLVDRLCVASVQALRQ